MVSERLNHSLNSLERSSIGSLNFDFTEIIYKFRVGGKSSHVDFARNIESFFGDYEVKLKKKFSLLNSQKKIYVWNSYDGIGICPGKNWTIDFERGSESEIELRGAGSDENNSYFSIFENPHGKRFTVYRDYTKKSQ